MNPTVRWSALFGAKRGSKTCDNAMPMTTVQEFNLAFGFHFEFPNAQVLGSMADYAYLRALDALQDLVDRGIAGRKAEEAMQAIRRVIGEIEEMQVEP